MGQVSKYRTQQREGAQTPAEQPVDPLTGILTAAAEQTLANPDEDDHASLRELLVGAFRQEIQKLQDTPVTRSKFQGGWLGAFQKPTPYEKQSARVGQLSELLSKSEKAMSAEDAEKNRDLLLDMVKKAYPDDPAKRAKLFRGLSPGKTAEEERRSIVTLPFELQKKLFEEFPQLLKLKGKGGDTFEEWLEKEKIRSGFRTEEAIAAEGRAAGRKNVDDITKRRRDFQPAVTPSPAITRHLAGLENQSGIPYGDQDMWAAALARANRNAIQNSSVLSIIGETNPDMLREIEARGVQPEMVDQVLRGPLTPGQRKEIHTAKVEALFSELGIGTMESHLSDLAGGAVAAIDGKKDGLSLQEVISSADWAGGHGLTDAEKTDLGAAIRKALEWARGDAIDKVNPEFQKLLVLEMLRDPTADFRTIMDRLRKSFGMVPAV